MSPFLYFDMVIKGHFIAFNVSDGVTLELFVFKLTEVGFWNLGATTFLGEETSSSEGAKCAFFWF